MVQYALGDTGSTVWDSLTTWDDLIADTDAMTALQANADVYGVFGDYLPQVIGIALVSSGGGAGTWQRVDEDGNNLTTTQSDFDDHRIWGGIETETIDGQAMVKIPKFYLKVGAAPIGSDQAGKNCWWVSDIPKTGFDVHPAFMNAGSELDYCLIGAYECSDGGSSKAASVSGAAPLVSIDFTTMQTRCEARNNGTTVTGFQMWNIYHVSAVQVLALIEKGTPDMQSAIGAGNTSSSAAVNTGTTNAVYRGIYELWGNVNHMVDGLQVDTSHQIKIWDKSGNKTLTSTGITGLGPEEDGWAVSLHDDAGATWDLKTIFLPETVNVTEGNGTFGDYFYSSRASENVCYHGGHWDYGSAAGLFSLSLNGLASASNANIGSRLAKV
jgi:hypothetical protein